MQIAKIRDEINFSGADKAQVSTIRTETKNLLKL
jgi:hypothetical protein